MPVKPSRIAQTLLSQALYRSPPTMATAYQMHIVPSDTGLWKVKQTDEAAKKASELLQQDMQDHHVFFNNDGFHNHVHNYKYWFCPTIPTC
jgi:hypothetical protein